MAKLETTLPHSSIHETAYFRTCNVAGLKSFRSVTGVGLRTFAVPRRSFWIEIIDDRSQSAVVDSLLELVSRRRKRVVSCSFLITAGRKRSTLFRMWQRGNDQDVKSEIQTTIAQNLSRSRLRRTSSVQSGTVCVCMVRSLTANRAATRSFKGRPGPL
jgi:hypothetical protein